MQEKNIFQRVNVVT